MKLKEYKLPKESFIGGWFIPSSVCDKLINYYNKFEKNVIVGTNASNIVNKKFKDSLDLVIYKNNQDTEIIEYIKYLQAVLNLYIKKYPELNTNQRFEFYRANIQKYPKRGGFKKWHNERAGIASSKRILVFMTYLNSIQNGGTKFKYQKITTPSKKGLTLIWPTDFTHTHKGEIVDKEKMIMTGWFEYI